MSGPVVVGFIFLIPSVLGMLFGILMMFALGSAATETSAGIKSKVREQLVSAGIPSGITEKVIAHKPLTAEERALLRQNQSRILSNAKLTYSAGQAGAGAGTAPPKCAFRK